MEGNYQKKSSMVPVICLVLVLLSICGGYYLGSENVLKLKAGETKEEEKVETPTESPNEATTNNISKIESYLIFSHNKGMIDNSHNITVKNADNCGGYTITYNGKEIANTLESGEVHECHEALEVYLIGDIVMILSQGAEIEGDLTFINLDGTKIDYNLGEKTKQNPNLNKNEGFNDVFLYLHSSSNNIKVIDSTIYIPIYAENPCFSYGKEKIDVKNKITVMNVISIEYLGNNKFGDPKIVTDLRVSDFHCE